VLVALPRDEETRLVAMLEARGVPAIRLGVTHSDGGIDVQDQFSLDLDELRDAWSSTVRRRFA
jgi:phosphoribosylformylglycinamidine synthase